MTEKDKEKSGEAAPETTTPATEEGGNGSPEGSNLPATTDDQTLDPYLAKVLAAKDNLITSLTTLHDNLKDEAKADLARLLKSVNPVKRGREETSQRWTIPIVRMVQKMTQDPPDNCKPGDLYTSAGSKVEAPMKFAPLYFYEVNRMFPADGMKGPVCVAPDAKLGTMFGLCANCPNLPLGKNPTGKNTDCDNGVCIIVLAENMRLYRLEFFRTSKKTGNRISQLTDECDEIWDRFLNLNTEQIKGDKGVFYVFRVSASGQDTPNHLRDAAEALYDMIRAERQASLKQHWDAVLRGGQQMSAVDEAVDLDSMEISGDGDDNPDLSDGGL
jgi:hypothetical protein